MRAGPALGFWQHGPPSLRPTGSGVRPAKPWRAALLFCPLRPVPAEQAVRGLHDARLLL